MPVTLAQAKLNVQTEMEAGVIDVFRKSSWLLDHITFHDCVSPTGGGATLTYGYTRLLTEATAAFRAVNSEYSAQEATKEQKTVELKIFGGSFEIDRIISSMGGFIDEVALQVAQKAKSTRALFADTFINGNTASDVNAFDGLNKALGSTSTEMTSGTDITTSALMDTNFKSFMDELDEFEALTCDRPTAWFGNSKLITKIKSIARRAGYYSQTEDAFGRKIDMYDGIPLIDLGAKAGSSSPIIGVTTPTTSAYGTTDLYSVCLGMEYIHGVSLAGQPPVRSWLPDYSTAGAVKKGEVEMVAAIAMKQTKAAAVLRGIKVSPKAAS